MRSLLFLILLILPIDSIAFGEEMLALERFGKVRILRPENRAEGFAIVLDGGAAAGATNLDVVVKVLSDAGYVSAVIDASSYLRTVQAEEDGCLFFAGEFERLGQVLQNQAKLPQYQRPLLVGTGVGGSLVYVIAAQSPFGFRGAYSFDFCPELPLNKEICPNADPRWTRVSAARIEYQPGRQPGPPWSFEVSRNCGVASLSRFKSEFPAALPLAIAEFNRESGNANNDAALDLPLIELPASENHKPYFVILLSGDGGWAGIDRDLGEYLNKDGVSVLGFDSLRYYWREKTPEEASGALAKAINHYSRKWAKNRVVVLGYSFGADVLAFLVSRLPERLKSFVEAAVFLNPVKYAGFEIHLSDWIGIDSGETQFKTGPEIEKLRGKKLLCIYGEDEEDSLCPELPNDLVSSLKLPGDHHFDGDYEKVSGVILDFLKR